jgi:hypothetical protein
MANGWALDGAVQDQIDDTVMDGVMRARARLPTGEGETHCVECVTKSRKRAAVCFLVSGCASVVSPRVIADR